MDSKFILQRRNFNIGPKPYVRPFSKPLIEPHYMNLDIAGDILKQQKCNDWNHHTNDSEVKNDSTEENIYENMEFINSIMNKENMPENQNCSSNTFVSTLSISVGKEKTVESHSLNSTVSDQSSGDSIISETQAFKSTYAKKLADSYQKTNTSSNVVSPPGSFEVSTPTRTSPDVEVFESMCKGISSHSTPRISPTNEKPQTAAINEDSTYKQVLELGKELAKKEDELTVINKNLLNSKLEISRLKAENRSLKVVQNSMHQYTPNNHNRLQSLNESNNIDIWTLQKQVITLKNQLEKAEMTRHAYECATKQLVQFLQTINSTLTTISIKEVSNESSIHDTNEVLRNLQNDLNSFTSTPRKTTKTIEDPLKSRYRKLDKKVEAKPNKKTKENRRKSDLGPILSYHKTESVMDLRPMESQPKVNRAVSTQCISNIERENVQQKRPSSLIVHRNKGFITSLKNLFRIESDKHYDTCQRKKQVKKKSSETDNDVSLQGSIFYVSYDKNDPIDEIDPQPDDFIPPDLGPSLLETIENHQLDSGPHELSVGLDLHDMDSGYVDKTAASEKSSL